MIKEIKRTSKIVEEILKEDKRARVDDEYLIYKFVEKINPNVVNLSFKEVMTKTELNCDTIRRVRQKLQASNPELGNYTVKERRQEREAQFRKTLRKEEFDERC